MYRALLYNNIRIRKRYPFPWLADVGTCAGHVRRKRRDTTLKLSEWFIVWGVTTTVCDYSAH